MTHSIRSFVRRAGRMTAAQERGWQDFFPVYGIDINQHAWLDLVPIFGRTAEKHLEIGFGMGDSLLSMAQAAPQHDFVGIDVHPPGVGKLLNGVAIHNVKNLRVICGDAVALLRTKLPAHSLDRVYIFFPDPWHKARHHKRRLIQTPFVHLLAGRLRCGGVLHLATDWEPYAAQMLTVLDASPYYRNLSGMGQYALRPNYRPLTKFEQRGQRLGHGVWDLLYMRVCSE